MTICHKANRSYLYSLISPLINEMFLNKPLRVSKRLLAPIIEERKRRAQEEGKDWKGRPVCP